MNFILFVVIFGKNLNPYYYLHDSNDNYYNVNGDHVDDDAVDMNEKHHHDDPKMYTIDR